MSRDADGSPMTPARAAELLARHVPVLAGAEVEPLGEGDFFQAFCVGGAWVARFARHAEAAAALGREASLLPRIAWHLPLRVPRPVLADGVAEGGPAFAVHPLVAGPALTRERYEALPQPARDRCARAVGRFLARLHAVDPEVARACGVPEVDYRARYGALRERAREALSTWREPLERAWALRRLDAYLASDDPVAFRPVLLHGDLSPDHVLHDEHSAEVTGIIDFGDVALGDPAWDLVYVCEDYGMDFLARLLPAYAPAGWYPLMRRMRRLLELDAVAWAVDAAEAGDAEGLRDARGYLARLRREAESPPWSILLAADWGARVERTPARTSWA